LAELVDNSIQAGLSVNDTTQVEVICTDTVDLVTERRRQRINEVAVYDNACGMDAETLRIALQFGNGTHLVTEAQDGIGKFGMGLPNASISQCCRVDVWSWQDGQCLHTYIDIGEIRSGTQRTVPEPEASEIPDRWRELIRDEIGDHGTLVVWSKIDRVRWRTSLAFFRNAEFLIGRMYRYFLRDKKVSIRLASFEDASGQLSNKIDRDVRPNDPLYLMAGAALPSPFDEESAFDLVCDPYPVEVRTNGQTHQVMLTFTIARKEAREAGGSSELGRDAARNQGVSLVRAGRELEMNSTFDIRYDPRESWWGVEVSFGPELDDVFGVTNNKQSATAFRQCELDEDAKSEGMSPGEYRDYLVESGDPRLAIYEVSHEITKTLRRLRDQIKRMREGTGKTGVAPAPGSAEDIATRATKRRREEMGTKGESDDAETMSDEEKEAQISEELVADGIEEEQAKEIAVEYVRRQFKYLFQEASVPGSAIFDIRSKAGTIIILLNTRHPASEHLFAILKEDEEDTPALKALKLLLTAWARLEDEAGETRRQQLEDIRTDWGRIARDFLNEAEE